MDTITHIVLGACIGEAVAGRQLGKKALVLGTFAQSIPDLDFIASFWLPTTSDLLAHRGITHSFFFVAVASPLLAWASTRLFRKDGLSFRRWLLFWGLQIFVHIFIDAFNAYGTGWFEPFSHARTSFNTLFVADPLFSLWPAIACVALLVMRTGSVARHKWAMTAICLSTLYLFVSIGFKTVVNATVRKELTAQHIEYDRFFTTPTPLNALLWYIVAENDSGFFIGYRSILDKTDNVDFHFDFRNEALLQPYRLSSVDLVNLKRFSEGYYAAQMWHDTVVFSDLRFGEIRGWEEPQPRPAFYYFLQYPAANKLVVQRGRFAGWNGQTFRNFLRRIAGDQSCSRRWVK